MLPRKPAAVKLHAAEKIHAAEKTCGLIAPSEKAAGLLPAVSLSGAPG
jgi:hypothetical protein